MRYTVDEVMKYIEEEDAKFIRLAFCDAFGVQKNIAVTPGEVMKAFEYGIPVNARRIAGFKDCPYAALYLKPDSSTLAVLPWRPDSGRVLRMLCDLYTPEGQVYRADTRASLKKAQEEAASAGVSFQFGTEAEFYLFNKDENGQPTKIPYDRAGYMDIAPADKCENIRREISLTIEQMGLVPMRSHHESGPGQNEINFRHGKPLASADQVTTFKMVVHTIADRYGLCADFSPAPLPDEPGNGYHINIFARDEEGNDLAAFAAAGILERIREMTIFLNPTDASYVRLAGSQVPEKVNWSSAGKSELMYMEKRGSRVRAQLRSPDAGCNPYLVYALLIHAGLSGIRRHLELPAEMAEGSLLLPGSRREAASLADSSDFVRSIVPDEILAEYVG